MNAVDLARESEIAYNNAWHRQNLEQWLAPIPEFVRTDHLLAAEKWFYEFCQAEIKRCADKMHIMEKYKIDLLPSAYRDLEHSLLMEAVKAIDERKEHGARA